MGMCTWEHPAASQDNTFLRLLYFQTYIWPMRLFAVLPKSNKVLRSYICLISVISWTVTDPNPIIIWKYSPGRIFFHPQFQFSTDFSSSFSSATFHIVTGFANRLTGAICRKEDRNIKT